ncbi:MAG: HDIG domain-containing protein [FCB group bacterium]|jgi:putative nucleotidyltransferase with HDIG domain|nr:HDIG domain-containing protein [FCB group bacterium]
MMFGKSARKKSRLGSGIHRLNAPSRPGLPLRDRVPHWLALIAAFLVLTAALALEVKPRKQIVDYDFETAQIAKEDIRAEIDFKSEDRSATAEAREEAARKVPDVYRVDQEAISRELMELQERIDALAAQRDGLDEALRQALLNSDSSQDAAQIVREATVEYARRLTGKAPLQDVRDAEALSVWLMPDPASVPKRRFEPASAPGTAQKVAGLDEPQVKPLQFAYFDSLGRASRNAIQSVLTYGILPPDAQSLPTDPVEQRQSAKIRILRDRPIGGMSRAEEMPLIQVPVPAKALELLKDRTDEFVASDSGKPAGPLELALVQRAAYEIARAGITDTLHLDKVELLAAREAARRAVEPTLKQIYRNAILQKGGEAWTEQSRTDVRALIEKKRELEGSPTRLLPKAVAAAILAGLVLAGLGKALKIMKSKKEKSRIPLYAALVIMCATVAFGRLVSYFGDLGYLVPLTAGAILLAILTNARVASITAFLSAALLSAQFGYDWQLFVVSGAMALSGGLSVHVVRRRNEMTRAAISATVVGLLATAAVNLSTDSLLAAASIHRLVLIALNGLACIFIVPGLLPPLERLFGITTDIQLLEYSDLNNEVLSRMAIEVPATYAHSLMLGQLAEAAADAIGANGLLARVSAYYHDIGKLRRPEYFSENQTNGNVHDTLSPRLSARAIAAHVLQGAEMAREAHLPKPLVDGIFEHHGTSLISFFYQQAQAQSKHGDVREEDFRYPGPKPQSRETAILMICDAVESGVRSIKNPNEDRVREFVDKIVAARAADRQFDESDLTLKDLDVIADVVTKRILTGLHTRIAYPEPEREKKPLLQVSGAKE